MAGRHSVEVDSDASVAKSFIVAGLKRLSDMILELLNVAFELFLLPRRHTIDEISEHRPRDPFECIVVVDVLKPAELKPASEKTLHITRQSKCSRNRCSSRVALQWVRRQHARRELGKSDPGDGASQLIVRQEPIWCTVAGTNDGVGGAPVAPIEQNFCRSVYLRP